MLTRVRSSRIPSQIVCDPSVMGGRPVVRGTRIPAEIIVAYLRAGRRAQEIFADYPSLPIDGIDAVIAWANDTLGPDWRNVDPDT